MKSIELKVWSFPWARGMNDLGYQQNHTTNYTKLLYQAFTELKMLTDILHVCLIEVIQPIDPHAKDTRMAKPLQDYL